MTRIHSDDHKEWSSISANVEFDMEFWLDKAHDKEHERVNRDCALLAIAHALYGIHHQLYTANLIKLEGIGE